MLAAHLDFGEDVFVGSDFALFVDVDHGSSDVKESDHLWDVGGDGQRMGFSGWLENVAALGGNPIVLEVVPFAFNDEAMNRGGVAVAAEDAGLADAEKIDPVALAGG